MFDVRAGRQPAALVHVAEQHIDNASHGSSVDAVAGQLLRMLHLGLPLGCLV